ncbi:MULTISPECIES: hypothetical protein [Cytobacillus]|uniref:hypothetical protein n=1 Tax=Cytobacillus TaxID=2675230 RepID=UPI00203F04C7|nr:hypothetical protein [Cytobacillus firmus]MCM3708148.1 hypothetical protein [Cytobacillus firmus]
MKKGAIIMSIMMSLLVCGCSKDAVHEFDLNQLTRVDIFEENREFIISEKEQLDHSET